jgi:hypothetical protein
VKVRGIDRPVSFISRAQSCSRNAIMEGNEQQLRDGKNPFDVLRTGREARASRWRAGIMTVSHGASFAGIILPHCHKANAATPTTSGAWHLDHLIHICQVTLPQPTIFQVSLSPRPHPECTCSPSRSALPFAHIFRREAAAFLSSPPSASASGWAPHSDQSLP